MPRPLILLIAFSLFSATVYGQDAKKPSPVVKRVLDEAVREVKKNGQEFDKANQKPLGDAKKKLQDEVTKLVESGKTDDASAVLAQVKTLEADVMKMANAPAPVGGGGGRVQPQKPLMERLEGKWQNPTDGGWVRTIDREGRFTETLGKNSYHGQLKVIGLNSAEVLSSSGWRMVLYLCDENVMAILAWNPEGKLADDGRVYLRLE